MKEKQSKEPKKASNTKESKVTDSASVLENEASESIVTDEPIVNEPDVIVPVRNETIVNEPDIDELVIENVSNKDDDAMHQAPEPTIDTLFVTQNATNAAEPSVKEVEPAAPVQQENLQQNNLQSDDNVDGSDMIDSTYSNETLEDASNAHAVIRRVRSDPKEEIPAAPPNKGFLYSFLDTLRFVSLGLVIGILLVVFVVQRNDVFGSSMEPNLLEDDAVFVEMISKYFSDYDYGYIVTIDASGMEGYSKKEKIIKRVIAKPGDTVEIKDGSVYVNGFLLDESAYLPEGVPTNMSADGTAKGYNSITLGADEYYCMGDNRGTSLDSRALGPFPESRIKAHVIAKIYPFDDMEIFN
jgi:signal peptidase I